jgi:hypothetical protein
MSSEDSKVSKQEAPSILMSVCAIVLVTVAITYEHPRTALTHVFVNEHGECEFARKIENDREVEVECPENWKDQSYRQLPTVSKSEQLRIEAARRYL